MNASAIICIFTEMQKPHENTNIKFGTLRKRIRENFYIQSFYLGKLILSPSKINAEKKDKCVYKQRNNYKYEIKIKLKLNR